MLSPFIHQVSSLLSPFLNRRRGSVLVGSTSPLALFSGGAIGVWFDPSDVANLAWQRNLLTYSEQFDNVAWQKISGSITATNIADPIGGNTAEAFTSSGSSGVLSRTANITVQSGGIYTVSVWLKLPSGTDTILLAITTSGLSVLQSVNCSVTSSWQRFTVSGSVGANTVANLIIGGSSTIGLGEVLHVWGAQLELGSVATDYQRINDINAEVIERFPTATMYEDATGTIPVTTPGQPVGLRLDKSKGLVLGPELVTNGDFASSSNWAALTGTLKISSGVLTVALGDRIYQAGVLPSGSPTVLLADVSLGAAGSTNGSFLVLIGTITYRFTFSATSAAGGRIQFRSNDVSDTTAISVKQVSGEVVVDNISVKELPGNHATQSTLAARPTYGIEPRGGRRNLLTYTEQVDVTTGGWTKETSTAPSSTGTSPPFGTSAVNLLTDNSTNVRHIAYQTFSDSFNVARTFSVYAKQNTLRYLVLTVPSGSDINCYSAIFDLQGAGAVTGTKINGSSSLSTAITPLVNGWFRCSISGVVATTGSGNFYPMIATSDRPDFTGTLVQNNVPSYAGTGQSLYIWGAQLEVSSVATPYQKVTTEYDVTEAGVPTCHYVAYGGSHSMATAAIDFTATDKMSVFAGVSKLSEGVDRVLIELSSTVNTNNGSFGLFAPSRISGDFVGKYVGSLRGTVQSVTEMTGFPAPISNVLSALYDISGATIAAESVYRINGTTPTQTNNGIEAGTGNFGNYPLFIGRRNNAQLPFNGRDYGIIVVGKTASPTEISTTETWLGEKTGFFAPVITGVPTIGVS